MSKLFVLAPRSYEWRELLTENPDHLSPAELYSGVDDKTQEPLEGHREMDWAQKAGAFFIGLWLHLIFLMMLGFAYSYFWSASTIVYFLLRKKVDDTDFDEVFPEEEEEEPHAAPAAAPPPADVTGSPTTLPMAPPERRTPDVPKAEPAKAETPGMENPKPETAQVETPTAETPKAEPLPKATPETAASKASDGNATS